MKLTVIEKPHPPQQVMAPHLRDQFGPQEPEPPHPFGLALYGSAVYFESTTRWQEREEAEAATKLFIRGVAKNLCESYDIITALGWAACSVRSCDHDDEPAGGCHDCEVIRTAIVSLRALGHENCPHCHEPLAHHG